MCILEAISLLQIFPFLRSLPSLPSLTYNGKLLIVEQLEQLDVIMRRVWHLLFDKHYLLLYWKYYLKFDIYYLPFDTYYLQFDKYYFLFNKCVWKYILPKVVQLYVISCIMTKLLGSVHCGRDDIMTSAVEHWAFLINTIYYSTNTVWYVKNTIYYLKNTIWDFVMRM